MKHCTKCGTDKPVTEFYSDKARTDGRHPYCSECCRAYQRQYKASRKGEMARARRRHLRAVNELIDRHRAEYETLLGGSTTFQTTIGENE